MAKSFQARGDEKGIVLVLVTISLTLFIGIAALVIDLGTAYSTSRQTQNAADAAATAAATELECLKFEGVTGFTNPGCVVASPSVTDANTVGSVTTTGDIGYVAYKVASDDGANVSQVTCDVISGYIPGQTPPYDILGSCNSPSSWDAYVSTPNGSGQQANGVYVETGNTQQTVFGGVTGTKQTTELRQAAATIQPIGTGNAPLAVCYSLGTDPNNENSGMVPNLLIPATPATPVNEFIPGGTNNPDPSGEGMGPLGLGLGYQINPAAFYNSGTTPPGPLYLIHGPNGGSSGKGIDECGLSASKWKGDTCIGDSSCISITVPGWLGTANGEKNGPLRGEINGEPGCNINGGGFVVGCFIAIPICVTNTTGATPPSGLNNPIYCVTYGNFQLLQAGNGNSAGKLYFGLVPSGNGTGGTTTGNPTVFGVNAVVLVQ